MKDKEYVSQNSSDWLNLKPGENKIRIVSEFDVYGQHFMGKGQPSLICIGKEEGCIMCNEGQEWKDKLKEAKSVASYNKKDLAELESKVKNYLPRATFLRWVIDRTDNQVKLLRYGSTIQSQIADLAKSVEYGFDVIPNYDMTITKKGQGFDTEYTVMASRKDTELTQEEKNMIVDKVKSVSEIIERMKVKIGTKIETPVQPSKTPDNVREHPDYKDIPVEDEKEEIDLKDIPF